MRLIQWWFVSQARCTYCTPAPRIAEQIQLGSSAEASKKKIKRKSSSFAEVFPPWDSAPGHSRNSADGKSRRSRGLGSESPFRKRSAAEVVPLIVKICASPLARQRSEISSHPPLSTSLSLSLSHTHAREHTRAYKAQGAGEVGSMTDRDRQTSHLLQVDPKRQRRQRDLDGTPGWGLKGSHPRGHTQHVAGGKSSEVAFTSELPCNPIRTPSCLTIQQFIHSPARSSHGGHAEARRGTQLMHRVCCAY